MKNNNNINKVLREQKFFHTPFYKRKSVIISASSILGVGALTAAIVTPVVLLTGTKPLDFSTDINILNAIENHDNRIKIWNDYFSSLSNQNTTINNYNSKNLLTWTPDGNKQKNFKTLTKDISFINEFISMFEKNLLISPITVDNSVSKDDLSLLVKEMRSLASDIALNEYSNVGNSFGSYWNPSSFQLVPQGSTIVQNNTIWYFQNQDASIKYEFMLPSNNVSLEYLNNASKIIIKNNRNSTIRANNIRVNILSNSIPAFTTKKTLYFKVDTAISIPSKLFAGFSDFFIIQKKNATSTNVKYKNYFENLKKEIAINPSISLTLWNQFILNYSQANDAHIVADLKSKDSKMMKLISDIAKENSSNTIKLNDALNSFKEIAQNPTPAGHKELIQPTPYGLINFGTKNTDTDDLFFKYQLNTNPSDQSAPIIAVKEFFVFFDILEFDFDVKFNSFFSADKVIFTPKIKIGPNSKFKAMVTTNGVLQTYAITPGWYDITSIIDTKSSFSIFFDVLINNQNSALTNLTNSLIKFNSNKNANKVSVWNDYALNMKSAILRNLQDTTINNSFIKHILSNVRDNLLVPDGQVGNSFLVNTSAKQNLFSTNFAKEMLTITDLDFTVKSLSPDTETKPLISFTNPIKYDTTKGYYVDIYFGSEDANYSSMNMNLAQTPLGSATNFSSFAIQQTTPNIPSRNASNLINAAKKRFSIVLKDSTDQNTMFVGFLGLKKDISNELHTSGYTLYNNFFNSDIFISSINKIL